MEKLGRNINQAGKSYEEAYSQLKTGRGSLTSQAETLRKLGVKNTKDIPGNFIEEMGEEA